MVGETDMDLRSKLGLYNANMEKASRRSDVLAQTSVANDAGTGAVNDTVNRVSTGMGTCAADSAATGAATGAPNSAADSAATSTGAVSVESHARKSELEIEKLVPGYELGNENGSCYVIESRYPSARIYGGIRIGEAEHVSEEILEALGGPGCEGLQAGSLLYLDTETTGLSGGAGTVAFLTGVGFFRDGEFVVRQYFMRDYDEEAAVLTELKQLFEQYRGFVTFNGKSFDCNLLQSRFISNRLRSDFRNKPNLDLLYPSRKIWGLKLESCRLSSLEENILGEFRNDDIPGALIPSVYFKYLEDRDATEIRRVIRHNELDVLSMGALLGKLSLMLQNPLTGTDMGYELLGLGRIFEASGNMKTMLECLEACTASEEYGIRSQAVRRITEIYKRNGSYDLALEQWNAMEERNAGFELFHLVEMAKYYEHKQKDIEFAMVLVDKAVQNCCKAGLKGSRQYEELIRRRERLRRKQTAKQQSR